MSGYSDWAESIGNTDQNFKNFCNDLDSGKVVIDDIDSYMNKASSSASKFGLALKNIGINIGISIALSLIAKGIEKIVHAADDAKESADKFSSSFNSMNDEFKSNDSKISDLQKQYDELSKGVNSLGENVSLTTDEYDNYKQVVSEISDLMPNLITRHDEEGNKIGFVKGQLEDLNAEYDKYKKNKALDLVTGTNDNGDSISDVFNNYDYLTAHTDVNGNLIGKRKLFGSSNYEKIASLQDEIDHADGGAIGYKELTNEEIDKKIALIQKYQNEIDASVSSIKNAISAIAQSRDEYYKLTDEQQQFVDTYINSLSEDFINKNGLTNETAVRTFVNNFITDIKSNKNNVMDAYKDLFSFDVDDETLNPDQIQEKVDQMLQALANALGEDDWKDLKIRLGFEFVDDNASDYEKIIGKFNDQDKLKGFFSDEGINTISEVKEFNEVYEASNQAQQGIYDVDIAMQLWKEHTSEAASQAEASLTSFEGAWINLKNTDDDDLKKEADNLLDLAEAGQLTANALSELAGGQELMNNTGLSADELAKKINSLVDASTQLNAMSGQISKMSDMLADKKNGVTADASDLAGFDASVRGLESWDQFEKVMGDSKSSMKDCQEAANALATEWVNNSNFLENLTEDNQSYYVTQLKAMGVENAEAIVTDTLAQKKNELAIQEEYEAACKETGITASADLATVTGTEIQALLDEGKISVDTASKLAELVTKKRLVNGISLTTSGDIQNLAALAGMTTKVGKLLAEFARIKQLVNTGMIPQAVADTKLEGLQAQIEEQLNGGNNTNVGVNINPSGSSSYKAPSSKKSKSSKDSKSTIDWIDRKLSVLQTKIDLTQSKFDNLFNLTSPKNLKKNIDSVTKSLSSAQSKAESFKKKMSSVNLDSSTKKKVQNGTAKLSDYSKTDQKRIKQYQKYYSSYEKYATKVKNLQKQLNTLNSSRGKINNLETQIKQMKALESATSKAIKKYESYAGKVGLSKSLRNKVKNGDYTITDYDSKTQAKIQKYQDYIDKIAELRQQLQEIQGDIRDTKIQEYQLRADDADAKRSKSEAWTDLERVDNYKKINSHLEYQKKQVKESYKWQIQIAEAEGDSTKASQLRAEKEKELRDLTKQEFDAIASAYDYQLKLNDAKRQGVQDALSLAETRGDQIGSAYYSSQISVNNSDLNTRYEERERLLKKLSTMDKGTDEWYSAYDTLQSVNKEISSLINNNAELDHKIKQLKWDRFDELKNKIDDVITETSFLSDLLDSDNFFDDKGMITDDGVTAMGLALQNYDSYLAEAQKYGEQLAELEADYAAGNVSYDDYTSRLREYTQGQQNAIKSANDLKKTTISYVKQGLDAQNEALSKEIEQRKKLLEQAKTERDFNDKTLDQNKKIARLKRQIAILENDDSDSNRKTLRELRSQLQDVEKEQSDSFYDKSVSDQEDALDNMLENSKKQAEEYLKDTDKVFADAIVYVNAHADQVSNTLTKLAQDTGYNISEYITKAWRGSGDAVGDYASTMSQNVPKITQQIALITGAWEAQCLAADKAAEASAKAAQGFYSEGSGSGSNTNNTNNSNSNDDSAKDIKNYITKHLDKAGKSKSYYGVLNQYLYSKTGGKVLSKAEEVQLAKMLGVSVKSDLSGKNDRQKILDALKKKNIKFANGGILGDLVKVSGEDGLFIGSAGESVLTKEQTQALVKLAPVIPQMSSVMDMMKHVVPVNNTNRTENPINIEISNNVNGAVSQEALNEMKKIATNQAETVVKKINSATYAKGVRFR